MENIDINSYIEKGNNIVDNIGSSLGNIVEYLAKLAKTDSFSQILFYIAFIWTICIIISIIYIFLKYDLEHKPKVAKTKSFDFPEEIEMEKLEYSLYDKITENSFLATLTMLFYKKVLLIEKVLIPGNNEAYKIIRNIDKTKEMTTQEEKFLTRLFSGFAENNEISFGRIKNIIKNKQDLNKLTQIFINYKLDAYNSIIVSDYYEPIDVSFAGSISFTIIGFLVLIGAFKYSKLVILFGIIFLLYIIYLYRVSKRTQANVDRRTSWNNVKRAMNDISKLQLKELPHASEWQKYYAYGYVLGNQNQFYNQLMKKKPTTVGLDEDDITDYFDNLKLVGKVIIEFKKALLICKDKVK